VTNVWRERAQQILEIAGVATVKVLADDRDVCGFDVFHLYLSTCGTRP
jgi:1,6-anhydro-N-acetylmuramate kinase